MSRPIKPITKHEFEYLLYYARRFHKSKGEPIPELAQENWDKVAFALQAPFQTGYGAPLYRGFLKKASILFYQLAKGHRLANGNKRMACITLDFFCKKNDRSLVIGDQSLIELARYTAKSDPLDNDECVLNISAILKRSIKKA